MIQISHNKHIVLSRKITNHTEINIRNFPLCMPLRVVFGKTEQLFAILLYSLFIQIIFNVVNIELLIASE